MPADSYHKHKKCGVLVLCIVASIVYSAKIFNNFIPFVWIACLAVINLLTAYCVAAITLSGHLITALACAAWIAVIISQKIVFSINTETPFDTSALATNFGVLMFAVFIWSKCHPKLIMELLFKATVIYLILYIAIATSGLLIEKGRGGAQVFGVLTADSMRDSRIVLANGFAAFAAFYAVAELMKCARMRYFGALAIALWAISIAQSRMFSVIFASILVLGVLFRRKPMILGVIAAVAVSVGVLSNLYGLYDESFNVYSYISSTDESAMFRAIEYEIAKKLMDEHPVFGLGIGTTESDVYQKATGSVKVYFASDIGAIGILTYYGLFGFFIYIAAIAICIFPSRRIDGIGIHSWTIRMTVLVTGVMGITGPTMFSSDGRFLVGLLIYSTVLPQAPNGRRRIPSEAKTIPS